MSPRLHFMFFTFLFTIILFYFRAFSPSLSRLFTFTSIPSHLHLNASSTSLTPYSPSLQCLFTFIHSLFTFTSMPLNLHSHLIHLHFHAPLPSFHSFYTLLLQYTSSPSLLVFFFPVIFAFSSAACFLHLKVSPGAGLLTLLGPDFFSGTKFMPPHPSFCRVPNTATIVSYMYVLY